MKDLDAEKSTLPLQDDDPVDVGPVKKLWTAVRLRRARRQVVGVNERWSGTCGAICIRECWSEDAGFHTAGHLTLLRQILAMTDHDQQLPRVAHTKYGEAVGGGASDRNRRWASPLGLRRQPVPPVRSVLEWAYGSDETIG